MAESMKNHNSTGGMCCEPGLVFFSCNCHPMIAMRIAEQLCDGSDFSDVRTRFEDFVLSNFKNAIPMSALRSFVVVTAFAKL